MGLRFFRVALCTEVKKLDTNFIRRGPGEDTVYLAVWDTLPLFSRTSDVQNNDWERRSLRNNKNQALQNPAPQIHKAKARGTDTSREDFLSFLKGSHVWQCTLLMPALLNPTWV